MIEKEKLRDYARKLMFEMNDEEYTTLQQEFEVILKQMNLISKIDNIYNVEPMTYPFELNNIELREDKINNELETKEVLINVSEQENNQIKVPKVVE